MNVHLLESRFAEKWERKSIITEIADHDHVQKAPTEGKTNSPKITLITIIIRSIHMYVRVGMIVKRNLIADDINLAQTIAGITLGEGLYSFVSHDIGQVPS